MPNVTLLAVDPKRAKDIWHAARPMIEAAYIKSDQGMPPNILLDLARGTRILWLAVDETETILAAMLTQLFLLNGGAKMCKMQECGGLQMTTWKHLRKRIEEYAKAEGCDRVLVEGRVGWKRVLSDYKQVAVVLEKRI